MRDLLLRFRDDESGLTLVESVFIMLILLSLMVTGMEVLRYYRLVRHMKTGAESFADLMGQRRAPLRDLNWSEDSAALVWLVTEVRIEAGEDWRQKFGVQATYARFIPLDPSCQTDCVSTSARILWTWDGGTAGSRSLLNDARYLRNCALTLVPSNEIPAAFLPSDLFKGKDVLIVTLAYRFRPRVLSSLFTEKLLVSQTYVPTPTDRLVIDPLGISNEVIACP